MVCAVSFALASGLCCCCFCLFSSRNSPIMACMAGAAAASRRQRHIRCYPLVGITFGITSSLCLHGLSFATQDHATERASCKFVGIAGIRCHRRSSCHPLCFHSLHGWCHCGHSLCLQSPPMPESSQSRKATRSAGLPACGCSCQKTVVLPSSTRSEVVANWPRSPR